MESEKYYQQWIGREQSESDVLTIAPMEAMAATLDRENGDFTTGSRLPPLWHWLYFIRPAKQSSLALDGHPEKGDFLPPIPLPGRMWAGSRLKFIQALVAGEAVTRTSRIQSVKLKQGRSSKLAFVCVRHEISGRDGLALVEEHDIVYRDKPSVDAPVAAPIPADTEFDFAKTITADPVFLFRYSALTFNGHRIHYDRAYVTDVEAYPGLIVHGPLLATLLVELLTSNFPKQNLLEFEFKAIKPVFDTEKFHLCGNYADSDGNSKLWVSNNAGNLCLSATARLAKNQDAKYDST